MADQPRWCPFARVLTSRRAESFNRLVVSDVEAEPLLPLATSCVKGRCQLWDDVRSDCGLKHV